MIEEFLESKQASCVQKQLLLSLQKEIEKIGPISIKIFKTRISIKGTKKNNICVYEIKNKRNIEVSFNLSKSKFCDPKNLVCDVESQGVRGRKSAIYLEKFDDIEYIAKLIKDSYSVNAYNQEYV